MKNKTNKNKELAHWIFRSDDTPFGYDDIYVCSRCGDGELISKRKYCPDCGAKMQNGE